MQSVSHCGVTLHIRDEGPRDGRVVMFGNSLGSDLRLWEGLIPLLPRGCGWFVSTSAGMGSRIALRVRIRSKTFRAMRPRSATRWSCAT